MHTQNGQLKNYNTVCIAPIGMRIMDYYMPSYFQLMHRLMFLGFSPRFYSDIQWGRGRMKPCFLHCSRTLFSTIVSSISPSNRILNWRAFLLDRPHLVMFLFFLTHFSKPEQLCLRNLCHLASPFGETSAELPFPFSAHM